MISIQRFSIRIANYLCEELGMNRQTEIKMVFGLELLIGAVIKTFLIGFAAAIIGIFPETMVLVVAAGILRIFSGGEHCQAFYRCLLGGGITYLLLGLAVHLLKVNILHFQWVLHSLFLLILIIVNKYAPADTANRRIKNAEDIIRYKVKSLFIVVMFWLLILVTLKLRIFMSLIMPILTGLLWQAFTITPGGYKFIQTIDKVLTFGKRSDI